MIPGVVAGQAIVASGGGGGYAHEYWRLNVSVIGFGSQASAAEIEMRATVGGADQCTGGTASASGGTASNGFDNNDLTVWYGQSGGPWWLQYQFSEPVAVAELMYQCPQNGYFSAASAFTLEYSDDGSTWTTHITASGISWVGAREKKLFTP